MINLRYFILSFFVFDIVIVLIHITFGQFSMFNLDYEQNLPTIYQSIKLIIIGFILFLIAIVFKTLKSKVQYLWGSLATLFVFLGLDEVGQLHENLPAKLQELNPSSSVSYMEAFKSNGFDSSDWLLFYIPVFILAGIIMVQFLKSLYSENRRLFIVFMIGTLLFFMVPLVELVNTSPTNELNQQRHWDLIILEESLEMLGASTFLAFTSLSLKNLLRKVIIRKID